MAPPIVNNGIYKYIFTLLRYIDRDRFAFDFLMQAPEALMETEEYKEYRFGIRAFTTTQREDPGKFREEIYRILSGGYDVLELHTSYWRGFMIEEIAMEVGIPKVIVHSHSSGLDNNDPGERERQSALHEEFKSRFSDQYATDFWACSGEAADWLFGCRVPREKIRIVHNAIDIGRYAFDPVARDRERKAAGLEASFVVGSTGRLEYQKNHAFLLRAFRLLKEKAGNAKLMLVGEGRLKGELEDLAKELGIYEDVLFMGWRDDVPQLLQAMDVYCLPSRFEGLGIGLVEAQSAGLACIASTMVPAEANISGSFTALELDERAWAREILKYKDGYGRFSPLEEIREKGFDIRKEIKWIEEAYGGGGL